VDAARTYLERLGVVSRGPDVLSSVESDLLHAARLFLAAFRELCAARRAPGSRSP